MRIVTKDGSIFIVNWNHFVDLKTSKNNSTKTGTLCKVHKVENNEKKFLSEGIAELSKKDKYSKNVGRKISLQRALKNSSLTKEERIHIWNDYFNLRTKNVNYLLNNSK